MPTRAALAAGLPRLSCVAFVCACALGAAAAHGEVYKWTDANGRVQYSSVPPTGDVKVERVITSRAANPDAAKQIASQEAELRKRQLERAQQAEKAEKARADAARRDENCGIARGNLKALGNDSVPVDRMNEKGERVRLDAAMRAKERERLESYVRAECV